MNTNLKHPQQACRVLIRVYSWLKSLRFGMQPDKHWATQRNHADHFAPLGLGPSRDVVL
jgi:hypothetical protein